MHIFFDRMLKKLIRESFFNPALHFIPVFVFLFAEEASGLGAAWMMSLPAAVVAGAYIRILYRPIIHWYTLSLGFYFLITLTSTVLSQQFPTGILQPVYTEITMLTVLMVLFFIRKHIQVWVTSVTTKKLSMMNNLSEMIRFTQLLILLTAMYVLLYVVVSGYDFEQQAQAIRFLHQLFIVGLLLLGMYQTVRVFAIRNQLMKEEWWPIVNQHGKEIGSIHYHNSLWIERQKFTHPVVRVIVMEGNKILLHQNTYEGDSGVQQWDTALDSHVKYGESIQECIGRVGMEFYGSTNLSPVFLTNYKIENSCEYQFVHLFLSGRIRIERINPKHSLHLKWWTLTQICEELNSGIFTDNFIKEYELLMRSGLIDAGGCTCECNLRDAVHGKKTLA